MSQTIAPAVVNEMQRQAGEAAIAAQAVALPPTPAAASAAAAASSSSSFLQQHPQLRRLLAVAVVAGGTWLIWRAWMRGRNASASRRLAPSPSAAPNQLLSLRSPLHHSYFIVRHGESTANVEGVISSDPAISTRTHGLTDRGAEQVAEEIAVWSRSLPLNQPICVISSDFLRAKQTAEIIHRRLRVRSPLLLHPSLRERSFGRWNGGSHENYARVWEADARSADHTENDVESVHSVIRRCTQLVIDVETKLPHLMHSHQAPMAEGAAASTAQPAAPRSLVGSAVAAVSSLASTAVSPAVPAVPRTAVIFVAHGDVCQQLATAFANMDPRLHRSIPHWKNAEGRPLVWTPPAAATVP